MIPNNPALSKLESYAPPLIILLVGVGAFGLGRLSAAERPAPLRIIYPGAAAAEPINNMAAVAGAPDASSAPAAEGLRNFLASKNGTKYYLATCPGATRIKQENRTYFVSREAAEAAGYEPAANCPGL